jgi:hypothetical protein
MPAKAIPGFETELPAFGASRIFINGLRLKLAKKHKPGPPALEKTAIADYISLVFATELLATDVLGVVMARTMWARREKSSAGFHFVGLAAG